MTVLIALPVLLPMVAAVAMLAMLVWPRAQKVVALAFGVGILATAIAVLATAWDRGILVHALSDWPPPYGIVLVADLLAATLVVLTAGVFLAALAYSLGAVDPRPLRWTYLPLFFFLMAGVHGAFLTGDVFNLFVFFEVMLIAIYGLVITREPGGPVPMAEKLEATFKYLVLNLIGTAIMLLAIGTLYGTAGTLNMADLSVKVRALRASGIVHLDFIAFLFIAVFGLKAAMAPFHFWLPDVHPSAPTPVSAILSGILIKVGAYGMIRLTTLLFAGMSVLLEVVLVLGLGTLLLGGVLAIGQVDVKRLLAYSSVSQMGFLLVAVGVGGAQGIAAAVFFLVNHAIIKSMLFLAAGGVMHVTRERTLDRMGGVAASSPFLATTFLIGAFALAGLPPTNGFVSKLLVFQTLVDSGRLAVLVVALIGAFLSVLYAVRAWVDIFWGERRGPTRVRLKAHEWVPIGVLAALCLVFGLGSEPLLALATATGAQVSDPSAYVAAVLGGSP